MTNYTKVGLMAVCLALMCVAANATSIDLGAAGTFAVIGVGNTANPAGTLLNSNIIIAGDEGIGAGGTINNMAPSTVTGNVYQYQSGQLSGPGHVNGSVIVDPVLMDQAYADAVNAANTVAGLSATQTFTLTTNALTITGNGGLNVIDLNGDIKNTITLVGDVNDYFIIRVNGGLQINGSATLGGSAFVNHTLWDFTSTGKNLSTQVGNTMWGTMLALNDNYSNMDGTWNGGLIGGQNISMLSASHVNGTGNLFTAYNDEPVPEPGTLAMMGTGVLGLAGVLRRKFRPTC